MFSLWHLEDRSSQYGTQNWVKEWDSWSFKGTLREENKISQKVCFDVDFNFLHQPFDPQKISDNQRFLSDKWQKLKSNTCLKPVQSRKLMFIRTFVSLWYCREKRQEKSEIRISFTFCHTLSFFSTFNKQENTF